MLYPLSPTRLCASLVILFLMSNAAEAQITSPCARHTVTTYPLSSELNHVSHCVAALACPGQLVEVEIKRIERDGGEINQWLVSSYNVSATYTPGQQDMIIQSAKGLAALHKPASKYIVNIVFYWTTIPDLGPPNYFVGANITYGKCRAQRPG
jgi:hypothetical protein